MEHISSWYMLVMLMLGKNINTIKEDTASLSETSREVGLVVTAEKVKYEGHLKSLWTGGSAPLLCRGRQ
jgi:hypothetical protein